MFYSVSLYLFLCQAFNFDTVHTIVYTLLKDLNVDQSTLYPYA